ncbi:hypothetical protein DY000_02053365 [Brassica cretica]|uniref:Uncharacterized protein n=1 Tax=Brassica cretica TaxID=69181 RepID=A0ABQ7A8S6_BRACR|nr:hypothetical protein DY000_02053365 [Brassica cretica]
MDRGGGRKESYRIYCSALKIMDRGGGRKESYRIYCSALKVRKLLATPPCVRNSPLHYAAAQGHHEDIAFGVDTKCPQLLEPVEDVLHEVINGAPDR